MEGIFYETVGGGEYRVVVGDEKGRGRREKKEELKRGDKGSDQEYEERESNREG